MISLWNCVHLFSSHVTSRHHAAGGLHTSKFPPANNTSYVTAQASVLGAPLVCLYVGC